MKKILHGIWGHLVDNSSLIFTNIMLFVLMIVEIVVVVLGHARIMLATLVVGWGLVFCVLGRVNIGPDKSILDLTGLGSAELNSVFVIVLVDILAIWLGLALQALQLNGEGLLFYAFVCVAVRIIVQGLLYDRSKEGRW